MCSKNPRVYMPGTYITLDAIIPKVCQCISKTPCIKKNMNVYTKIFKRKKPHYCNAPSTEVNSFTRAAWCVKLIPTLFTWELN